MSGVKYKDMFSTKAAPQYMNTGLQNRYKITQKHHEIRIVRFHLIRGIGLIWLQVTRSGSTHEQTK